MYQYQVSFVDAIKRAFDKYCCFTGRASRSEYWWFYLFTQIVGLILYIPCASAIINVGMGDTSDISGGAMTCLVLLCIFGLACMLPSLGLLWRRLHDTGRSGWNFCWSFLPYIGAIVLLVFCCMPSKPEPNKYGPVPNLAPIKN